MKVFAIDPGSSVSGFVIWDGNVLERSGVRENDELLFDLPCDVDVCVIEDTEAHPQFTKTKHPYIPKQVIATQRLVGRYQQAWYHHAGSMPVMLSRRDIRKHLNANKRGRTPDSQVIEALTNRIGGKGTKAEPGPLYGIKSHAWQALAVAVTYLDQREPF